MWNLISWLVLDDNFFQIIDVNTNIVGLDS